MVKPISLKNNWKRLQTYQVGGKQTEWTVRFNTDGDLSFNSVIHFLEVIVNDLKKCLSLLNFAKTLAMCVPKLTTLVEMSP